MKKCHIGAFVFLFLSIFSAVHQSFAHQTVDFEGTVRIEIEGKIINEKVGGQATISLWGHEETNGNFDEAIYNFVFGTETSECGDSLDEITVKLSSYRENKYTT